MITYSQGFSYSRMAVYKNGCLIGTIIRSQTGYSFHDHFTQTKTGDFATLERVKEMIEARKC